MANDNTYIDFQDWEPEGGKRIAYNTSIVGMRYRQSAANAAFRWGKTPEFRFYAETDNPYDANAVAVIAGRSDCSDRAYKSKKARKQESNSTK